MSVSTPQNGIHFGVLQVARLITVPDPDFRGEMYWFRDIQGEDNHGSGRILRGEMRRGPRACIRVRSTLRYDTYIRIICVNTRKQLHYGLGITGIWGTGGPWLLPDPQGEMYWFGVVRVLQMAHQIQISSRGEMCWFQGYR